MDALAVAVTFVWMGLILGISFIEAPLKFRAPDVTLRIGLGIGRLVFKAVNTVESVLAAVLAVTLVAGTPNRSPGSPSVSRPWHWRPSSR